MAISTIDNNGVNLGQLGNRNLIINGAMQVAQRGTSVTGVTGNGYFICDRWYWDSNGSSATNSLEQSSDAPDGFAYSFKATATTAFASPASGDVRYLTYRFEGQDLQHLNFAKSTAKKVTVSFWVKTSVTGTAVLGIYQDDGALYYGKQYTVNAANTWEYKSVVVDLPTSGTVISNDNTSGLRIYFGLYSGTAYTSGSTETWGNITNWFVGQDNFSANTNDTFQITGVQLEVGDTATPFEHRSYGEELARCQRYFWAQVPKGEANGAGGNAGQYIIGDGGFLGTGQIECHVQYPVQMRASPTLQPSSGTNHFLIEASSGIDYFSNLVAFAQKKQSSLLYNSGATSGTAGEYTRVAASSVNSYVYWDAEL